ncbi:MAG: tripartite tricarboxylate transporter substrate-binding protein [Betaproteobacteria bacterium]
MSGAIGSRGVRLVLGFSPGSLSDHIARILRDALAEQLGAPVTIELKPDRNGIPAARDVAASAPDGATFFMATLGTHAIAPYLAENLPYDPLRDFTCVSLVSRSPMLLACHPSIGVNSVAELIDRARSCELTYATSAVGGAPHLAAELFQQLAGVTMRHVRYDQTEMLYRDLEAGRVALSFNNIISMLPRCRSGKLRALGVSSRERSAIALDIPTIEESGVAGYEMSNWVGIAGPRGMDEATAARLGAAVAAAVRSERVSAALRAQGIIPCGGSSREFATFILAETEKWRPIVAQLRTASDKLSRNTL